MFAAPLPQNVLKDEIVQAFFTFTEGNLVGNILTLIRLCWPLFVFLAATLSAMQRPSLNRKRFASLRDWAARIAERVMWDVEFGSVTRTDPIVPVETIRHVRG